MCYRHPCLYPLDPCPARDLECAVMWLANRIFPSVRRLQAQLAAANGKPKPPITDPQYREHADFLDKFDSMLASRPPGRLLEIGARNRTSPDRKPRVPAGWTYDGFDILPDIWVTIIGDAHNLRAKIQH